MNSNTMPDSLDVVIESSAQNTMVLGTKLIIDEIPLRWSKLNTAGIVVNNPFRRGLLSIYPNPVCDLLNIQTESKGTIELRVFNLNGVQMLYQRLGSDRERNLNIEALNAVALASTGLLKNKQKVAYNL
ncbi:MAG: T9SS type A sorting domain-containing protein [bacterium]|nr:T9SS type A sorting domain-containing protein [bacterium]